MAFSEIKKITDTGKALWIRLLQRRGPPHLCALERGCRKHNTNGSGITLNIQMGKLIVYAWIHHCDYLAPLASLLSSLKATQTAFCFPFGSIKKFRPHNETLSLESTPWIYANKCDFFCFNNLWLLCKVQTGLLFLWQTPSARSASRMTKEEDDFTTLQLVQMSTTFVTFTPTLPLCACYYLHMALWWTHKNINQRLIQNFNIFFLWFWPFEDIFMGIVVNCEWT